MRRDNQDTTRESFLLTLMATLAENEGSESSSSADNYLRYSNKIEPGKPANFALLD